MTVSSNSAMFDHYVPVQLKHFIHHMREVSFLDVCHRIPNAEYRDNSQWNEIG